MDISVIIPSYQPQGYLWDCLNSLNNQTFHKQRFEIILILNGCNNPYKKDIESFIASHHIENIYLFQTDIQGVSNARNMGLELAKGRYITFVDDDDYVSAFFLEELYESVSDDTISVCYPYAFIDGSDKQIENYYMTLQYNSRANYGEQHFLYAWKFFSGPCMKLIPDHFIQGKRFSNKYQNGEDGLFMFSISDKYRKIKYTSDKAIYYRRYREESALTKYRNTTEKVKNEISLIKDYSIIFFTHFWSMNWLFYLLRVFYKIKCIIKYYA